jgi:hypothetical protein
MTEKTIHINAHVPGLSDWLNLDGTIKMQLPYKSVRELAKKLAEVADEDHVNLVIGLKKGSGAILEVDFGNEAKNKD